MGILKTFCNSSDPMIHLVPITSQNVTLFRQIRLRALRDTPSAFGSTHEKELQLTDADWLERALRWNGETGIGLLAMDGSAGCGIAGSFLDEGNRTRAHLISMWTAPTHRQQGIGRFLVTGIADWARLRDAQLLQLMMTSSNETAMLFYERLGFTRTGRTEPYPNDSRLIEYEMSRPLR
jgi:ribosomal protein S18 acetylase RimI-like enzyme